MRGLRKAPASSGGDKFRDGITLMAVCAQERLGHGWFSACKQNFKPFRGWQLGLLPRIRPGTCGFKYVGMGVGSDSWLEAKSFSKGSPAGCDGQVYIRDDHALQFSYGLIDCSIGGGATKGNPLRTLPTRSCRCNRVTREGLCTGSRLSQAEASVGIWRWQVAV
jgi:hypothetical protein